jgi:histone-binding protein RBBP4
MAHQLSLSVAHLQAIEDVDWHKHHADLFASVSDDRRLIMYARLLYLSIHSCSHNIGLFRWDCREPNPANTVNDAHPEDINCVAFNPYSEFLMATGSSDTVCEHTDIPGSLTTCTAQWADCKVVGHAQFEAEDSRV